MSPLARKIILSAGGGIIAVAGLSLLWSYILSFQDVTFRFDASRGQIELIDEKNNKLYPKNNQTIQLTEGEYHIQNVGKNIEPNYRKLNVTDDTTTVDITYTYTKKYLDKLLQEERAPAQAALYAKYPLAKNGYRLHHEKLYGLGDIYGAVLVARTPSDNSDTLRVLLKKQDDKWIVLSTPPTPILSAPDYPNVDADALAEINRAK